MLSAFLNKRSVLASLLADILDEQFATVFFKKGTLLQIGEKKMQDWLHFVASHLNVTI